jgi:hypothetical protein
MPIRRDPQADSRLFAIRKKHAFSATGGRKGACVRGWEVDQGFMQQRGDAAAGEMKLDFC